MKVLAPDAAGIAEAAAALRTGGLVGLPTETVYGLAADATNGEAVARIYAAKGRPRFNPLIVHVADRAEAPGHAVLDRRAERLAAAFWPGPLTLVLTARSGSRVSDLVRAGLGTVALRVPAHPVARAVIAAAGVPLAAPSANRSGHVSATTADHVADDLGRSVAVVLDAGATAVGVESTILDASGEKGVRLLRPGGLPREAVEAVLGERLLPALSPDGRPIAPGMLASHYAPRARLRLDAAAVEPGEALLAFGPVLPPGADKARMVRNLSVRGDLAEAAAALFGHLRTLDRSGAMGIAAMPVPGRGLGEAIRDRLARAAAGR